MTVPAPDPAGPIEHERPSFCRTCHNGCAVIVKLDAAGSAVEMTGDRSNPLYQGYTCVKGRATPALHNHPLRLQHSMKRLPDGRFVPVAVETALDEIADRLRPVLEIYGPRAVAGYLGTAASSSYALTVPAAAGFFNAIRSPMMFGTETIDQPGKSIAKGLHGTWMAPCNGMIEPEVVILVGANPLVSHAGFPAGNPGRWLKERLSAGMKLIVVDPRRSDVAKRAFLHLQPQPGRDIAILAAIARVIIDEGLFDSGFVAENVSGLASLTRALRPFAPAEVAAHAGIDADELARAARTYAAAARAYIACGTGPSMSGSSTLIEYLRMNLMTLCGHWQRAGEPVRYVPMGASATAIRAQAQPPFPACSTDPEQRSRVRGLGGSLAGMPTAALADEILLPGDGQVRALISCAGNPVLAWPDQLRTIDALRALALLVSVDVYMSQTARLSHYVIAAKMSLEVPGINVLTDMLCSLGPGFGFARSYGHYSSAVAVPPDGAELIEEWEFFYGVAQRLGIDLTLMPLVPGTEPVAVDMQWKPTSDQLLKLLLSEARIDLEQLSKRPHGGFLPDSQAVVQAKQENWTGRLDVGNRDMLRDLSVKAAQLVDAVDLSADFPFRLISRRMRHVVNSTGTLPGISGAKPYNPAFVHPLDLDRLGIGDGDVVEIRSPRAAILGVVAADESMRQGVVAMAQGFGGEPSDDDAVRAIGSPTTRLTQSDDQFERYSGQPRMSGIPVSIRAAPIKARKRPW